MKGGEAVVETLITHGVDTAFTVPGESLCLGGYAPQHR